MYSFIPAFCLAIKWLQEIFKILIKSKRVRRVLVWISFKHGNIISNAYVPSSSNLS